VAALDTLIAVHDINDVLCRYCRSMDRVDVELGYSVWHENGTADYGQYYKGTGRGFIDWVAEYHRNLINHMHCITNPLMHFTGRMPMAPANPEGPRWDSGRPIEPSVSIFPNSPTCQSCGTSDRRVA
jgi:SnoaL-like domain